MYKFQLYKNTGRGIYIGAIDAITKAYIRKNEVFADAFNYFMYDGVQVIQPERLKELDSTEIAILLNEKETTDKKAVKAEAQQKYRDILKSAAIMEDGHTAYILLGIENQTDVNYAMPVRNMLYDALQYTKQVSEIADVHRRKKENSSHKSVSHAEFISGFYKSDRLIPVITLVIYFNAGEWDGPRSLLDMMEIPDPIVRRYAQDYQIHLINPNQIEDEALEKFQSSLREVMGCIKYSRSKEKLAAFINNNPRMNMEAAAARVIEAINHVPIRIQEGDGKFNMCEAIEEMIKDGREAGREVGRQEGQNRINQLIILLSKENRGDDIIKAAEDREYQEQLFKEFNL